MKFIMFTKHLEGLDVPGIMKALKSVGVEGADLCTRPGYPVNPENVDKELPRVARQFADEGLCIPLVTTPGDFIGADIDYAERMYAGCGEAGVANIKLGYWHWRENNPTYWEHVDIIRKEFYSAWALAGPLGDIGLLFSRVKPNETQLHTNGYPLRVLLTEPGKQEIYRSQLKAISQARSYIYIQNAYLTDDRILRELIKARRRGVDVRVIMPIETDHGPITRSNVLAANSMLDNGIRVFIYPGFSHVKAAVIDGWVCLGSANYDRLSLRLNRELNIASSDPGVRDELLEKLFEPDFKVSVELTEQIPRQWADFLVELIGDYLY